MKKYFQFLVCAIIMSLFSMTVIANESESSTYTDEIIKELRLKKSAEVKADNTSLNSIEVQNEDGTNTIYFFDQNIRYLDENGNTVEKDLSIVASNDKEKIKKWIYCQC